MNDRSTASVSSHARTIVARFSASQMRVGEQEKLLLGVKVPMMKYQAIPFLASITSKC